MIQTTSPWISNSSVTWELLRRKPDYKAYFKSIKNKGLTIDLNSKEQGVMRASRHFPTAHEFGLLAPADPILMQSHVS